MTSKTLARPSLRRRLLKTLAMSMIALLVLDAWITYRVALGYANRVHDRDLSEDAVVLAQLFASSGQDPSLKAETTFLLEFERGGRDSFSVVSSTRGLIAGSEELSRQVQPPPAHSNTILSVANFGDKSLRTATVRISANADDLVVTVAEALDERRTEAQEILFLASSMQAFLLVSVLVLVWYGVARGMRVLRPITRRLATRNHELSPIDGPDIPIEVLPLTQTIDELLGRVRHMVALHDRFIADAAHQLRTPLAGLSLHVERALANPRLEVVVPALNQVLQLTNRTARVSTQLLALARAQSVTSAGSQHARIDLSRWTPDVVSERVGDAHAAGIDLGYEGSDDPLIVLADAAQLHDLLDNLLDNCLRYAGHGATVNVSIARLPDSRIELKVEDDGPGVPTEAWSRLSERFYQVDGRNNGGSGLGLAIVRRIADQHQAMLRIGPGARGGFLVQVAFSAAVLTS